MIGPGKHKFLAKFVLLLAIPGDLSDQGVAVNFKAARAAAGYPTYMRIPRHVVAESAAEDFEEREREDIYKNLHRFSGKRLAGNVHLEDYCKTIFEDMRMLRSPFYPNLDRQADRYTMVQKAREGSEGEEPWTSMNLDGLECVSSAVHVVGFLIGYTGYNGRGLCQTRQYSVVEDYNMSMLPAMMREPEGDVPTQPKSKTAADAQRAADATA